ncbi:hypothetical protein B0A48_15406 [Cryoendolithus antarcticus]|uniref:F-box domain-containing protein n=1 Tax=Cryoendolithus antarcticus TaxID=1507870 RepID=A0A1V8SIE6_9PEZI|nr:hypothetical protein B0A48_15406 [Cryoendolithus antarcticus]
MSDSIPRLPPELLCHIIQHITDPFDLAQVCLTSRDLYRAATPALYRDMTIDVRALLNAGTIHSLLTNSSLKHTRILRCLSACDSFGSAPDRALL